jgi:phage gp36-like protein
VSQYATASEFAQRGLPQTLLTQFTSDEQTAALLGASAVADSYMMGRFDLPFSAWGEDLKSSVCKIAAYDLVSGRRGFNPEASENMSLRSRYEDAMRWLKDVARGLARPVNVVDSSPGAQNRTDVPQTSEPFTAQYRQAVDGESLESFWSRTGGGSSAGVGPPKPRGW